MTFDQWIDAVNAQVRARLGNAVRTQELSWDSAIWVSRAGTVVASLADDEQTAKISFDGGDKLAVAFKTPEATPDVVSAKIVERLAHR
ncbi:MAG TPA: hypothetical protein VME66_11070 [Candidatus Acidoferrales bacterium]|nr:hypothetical protein [Candidatus Acidoferrales bacterium]